MEPIIPSGATNSPSRKRFLTNPNPNQASTTASPESSLSSDSSSDRLTKKTRELPNLSDCHSCGHRINYSNPKERLQPLDSMWRIVLLCKKCSKQVKSSDLCPYCFSATAGMDCFKCRDCQRCIHKDCVGKYGGLAPWSYCCSGLGFSVCVDCWVPNSLVNSIRVYKRKSRKNTKVKVVPESLPMPDSRVLGGSSNGTKTLEEVIKDANVLVERKVADAVKAKEIALRKAVAAKSSVELANGVLNLVASKEEKGKSVNSRDNMERKVVDDAELAFMLHRAMNSSPRISRSKCLVDSSSLAVPGVQDTRGSASTSACSKLEVYSSNLSEKIDRTVSEASVCLKTSDYGSFIELSNGAVLNAKSSSEGNECQGHGQGRCNVKADRYLLKYRRIDKTVSKPSVFCKSSDCGSCIDLVSSNIGAVTGTRACLDCNEWQESGDGRGNEKHDRYSLKYARSCRNGNESPRNGEGIVNESHDQYMLKCTRTCVSGNDCEGNCNEHPDRYLLKCTRTCVSGNDCEGNCNEHPDRYLLKYTRTRVNSNECQGNGEGRCSMKPDRYSLKYTRNCVNGTECQGNGEGRCNEKPDRYLLKYSRTCLNGNQCLENVEGRCSEKPDRYLLKYEKRSISSKQF